MPVARSNCAKAGRRPPGTPGRSLGLIKGIDVADPARERAMAQNIKNAPAPLLVQLGDLHVKSVAQKIGGANIVKLRMTDRLSKVTEREVK